MSYSSACKTTTTTPCTNVPIHCPLCPPLSPGSPVTIWKYNTMAHSQRTSTRMTAYLTSRQEGC
ncbi:hypothetical protein BD413DRAFT_535097, partial [Trametes elegans]